jgi:hypothetical protein
VPNQLTPFIHEYQNDLWITSKPGNQVSCFGAPNVTVNLLEPYSAQFDF